MLTDAFIGLGFDRKERKERERGKKQKEKREVKKFFKKRVIWAKGDVPLGRGRQEQSREPDIQLSSAFCICKIVRIELLSISSSLTAFFSIFPVIVKNTFF